MTSAASDIGTYLRLRLQDNDAQVVLSSLVDPSRAALAATENKVVMALTAIDEDRNLACSTGADRGVSGLARSGGDTFALNLRVVLAATHRDYVTALNLVSMVIGFRRNWHGRKGWQGRSSTFGVPND